MATKRKPSSSQAHWKIWMLLVVGMLGLFNLTNADIWWHLRTGELIIERTMIPPSDWFTYTNPDSRWIDLHWAFQVSVAMLYANGGSAALVIAKVVIGILTFWILLSIHPPKSASWLICLCWLLPLFVFGRRFYVRPEMLSYLYLASTLAILWHHRKQRWLIGLLPSIQLLWVNCHSLFILQFTILAAYTAQQFLNHIRTPKSTLEVSSLGRRDWLVVTAACVTLSFCNPYGWHGVRFPLEVFAKVRGETRTFYHPLSGELRGTRDFVADHGVMALFQTETTLTMIALLLLTLLSLLWLLIRYREFSFFRWSVFIAYTYLMWNMTRNSVLFGIVCGFILVLNTSDIVAFQKKRTSKRTIRGSLSQIALTCVLLFATVSIPTNKYHDLFPTSQIRTFGFGEAQWYSREALNVLKQDGMPNNIYATHLGVAAVCIHDLGPEQRIFTDARLELNTIEVLQAYSDIKKKMEVGDASFIEDLRQWQGQDANSELPTLVINNQLLISHPKALQAILGSTEWRCVSIEKHDFPEDPYSVMQGMTVFLPIAIANELNLPSADLKPLRPQW